MDYLAVFTSEKGIDLINRFDLKMVLLFGSQVAGVTHAHSDIDLAYISNRRLEISEESRMLIELVPLLRSKHIDLVDLRHAPPLLKKQIARKHIVLYQTQDAPVSDFVAQSFREYDEARPLRVALHEYLTKRIGGFAQELKHA